MAIAAHFPQKPDFPGLEVVENHKGADSTTSEAWCQCGLLGQYHIYRHAGGRAAGQETASERGVGVAYGSWYVRTGEMTKTSSGPVSLRVPSIKSTESQWMG